MCVKESCYETTVVTELKGHYNPPVPLQKRHLQDFGVRVEGTATFPSPSGVAGGQAYAV